MNVIFFVRMQALHHKDQLDIWYDIMRYNRYYQISYTADNPGILIFVYIISFILYESNLL